MPKQSVRRTAAILVGLGAVASGAHGQIPEKFTNLKVLPEDLSRAKLVETMRGWAGDLGVRCGHCHSGGNPDTLEGVDFASDAKWEKRTARAMLLMVRALNADYLERLEPRPTTNSGLPAAGLQVECVTCHRGLARPETIEAAVTRVLAKDGLEAALQTYKELRSQHLTSGRYDFTQGPLNSLGEHLLGEGRWRDALPLLELNAEHHPSAPWTLYLVGEARLAAGDRARALEAFERSLSLSPDNPRTRKRVEELKAGPSPKS